MQSRYYIRFINQLENRNASVLDVPIPIEMKFKYFVYENIPFFTFIAF